MSKTLYQILGLDPEVEDIVIKAAYKALAQKYHPDKTYLNPDIDPNLMSAINESYNTLIDPVLRKKYDSTLGAFQPPPSFTDESQTFQTATEPELSEEQSSLIDLIKKLHSNNITEAELVALFEKLFEVQLSVGVTTTPIYFYLIDEEQQTYNFDTLKSTIVQKLVNDLENL